MFGLILYLLICWKKLDTNNKNIVEVIKVKKQKYVFEEIINEIKEMYLQGGDQAFYKEEGWCLYSKSNKLELKTECYVLPYPICNMETYTEELPQFAVLNKLKLVYRDEMLQDVITEALSEEENISNKKILKAIKYYEKYDTFMDID